MHRMIGLLLAAAIAVSGCAPGTPGPAAPVAPKAGDPATPQAPGSSVQLSPTPLKTRAIDGIDYLPDHELTVVRPVENGPWAVVVAYHGIGASPRDLYPIAQAIAARGIVVFIPDWDAPNPWDNNASDVTRGWEQAAAALRYARAHAGEHGTSARRLIAIGHSWGASVAMALALSGDEFTALGGSRASSTLPDGVVAIDGPMDTRALVAAGAYLSDPAEWNRMNPAEILRRVELRDDVEYRLLIGGTWPEGDASNRAFERQLREKGGPVTLQSLGQSHGAMLRPHEQTVDAILELAEE